MFFLTPEFEDLDAGIPNYFSTPSGGYLKDIVVIDEKLYLLENTDLISKIWLFTNTFGATNGFDLIHEEECLDLNYSKLKS